MEDFESVSKKSMDESLNFLIDQYKLLRVGRPNPYILDSVYVDYYGTPTKINQMAAINVDGRTIVVKPWDMSLLNSIDKAILKENLGITPQNDGEKIRLVFPPLTSEEREKTAKQAKDIAENAKISIRNVRQNTLKKVSGLKKSKELSDDDANRIEKKIQNLVEQFNSKIELIRDRKIQEIMDVGIAKGGEKR